jgi:TonB family protein
VLTTTIDVDGSPHIHVFKGTLGSPALDNSAIETLRKWNFAPAMLGDKPVAVVISIDFQT